jgi:hypothetical protein
MRPQNVCKDTDMKGGDRSKRAELVGACNVSQHNTYRCRPENIQKSYKCQDNRYCDIRYQEERRLLGCYAVWRE